MRFLRCSVVSYMKTNVQLSERQSHFFDTMLYLTIFYATFFFLKPSPHRCEASQRWLSD